MRDRKLIRLTGFNYGASRHYFFTICVKDHCNSFGNIQNKSMCLSSNGIIALEQWNWLGDQYPYIDLISFVIMPDHIHGIIYINAGFYNHSISGTDCDVVVNGRDRSLQSKQTNSKIKPLPELIGAYKTTVSKRIHISGDVEFKWQKSFHDHIIRNIKSLNRIKHYMKQIRKIGFRERSRPFPTFPQIYSVIKN
jgi:putative transposase